MKNSGGRLEKTWCGERLGAGGDPRSPAAQQTEYEFLHYRRGLKTRPLQLWVVGAVVENRVGSKCPYAADQGLP